MDFLNGLIPGLFGGGNNTPVPTGTPSSGAPGSPDYQAYLDANPDIAATYASNAKVRAKWASPLAFAQAHYAEYGQKEGRALPTIAAPVAAPVAATPVADATPVTPTPTVDKYNSQAPATQDLARRTAEMVFRQRGLDPSQYMDAINNQIENVASTGDYFSPTMADDIISRLEMGNRSSATNKVNSTFTPNYADKRIDDSWLDDTINSVIGTQFGDADTALKRAQDRGQFNQVGFDRAKAAEGTARTGATSKLNSLEGDVLSKYRTELTGVGTQAANRASSIGLGDTFNLDDYTTQADNVVGRARTNAPGDLINALGGEKLFDLQGLMNQGGEAQGAQNLGDLDVAAAIDKKKASQGQPRGLGSQGAY